MDALRVAVRIRPEDTIETDRCLVIPEHAEGNSSSKISIIKDKTNKENDRGGVGITSPSNTTNTYEFDRIFGTESTQSQVFEYVQPLVDECLKGFNVTIFAFGMTGSGKTHTISGDLNGDMGILPRAVNHVFDSLRKTSCSHSESVSMVCLTYVELYNNHLNDLLCPVGSIDGDATNLKIHEHPKRGIYLTGSKGIRTPVTSPEECMQLIQKGNRFRATGSTNLNDRSSRSHTVISLEIITRDLHSENSGNSENLSSDKDKSIISVGKLNLVDLAGSERVKLSGASGQTFEEAKQINKALAVLGDVLNSLGKYHQGLMANGSNNNEQDKVENSEELASEAGKSSQETKEEPGELSSADVTNVLEKKSTALPKPHIPYRNSKLTMLLKDSLGGNSKTMMLTTVRMSKAFFQQTDMSLKYAARAKHIQNIPTQNIGFDETDNSSHGANMMRKTLEEVARLKEQLEVRSKEYDTLKMKLENLEKDGNDSIATQELEKRFKDQIEQLNQEKDENARKLNERMKVLVSGHNSVLEQKNIEQQEMKSRLKQHQTVIESLNKEKKIASINQQKTNNTIHELYRKISEGEAEISGLKYQNQSLTKELEVANEKIEVFDVEKSKFVEAIKKLMESRQKHKSKASELDGEHTRLTQDLELKLEEIEAAKSEQLQEREENERKFTRTMDLLKKSEEKVEELMQENNELKQQLDNCKQQQQHETKASEALARSGSNEENNRDIGSEESNSDGPPSASVFLSTSTSDELKNNGDNEDTVMKRDRLQVENVALKQKIRLLVEEEKYMLQKLETKTAKLNDVRSKLFATKKELNEKFEEMRRNNFDIEGERDELQCQLLVAERRIEVLESSLEIALLKLKENDKSSEKKDGGLTSSKKLSSNFKLSLQRTRKDREEELRKAITMVKQHVAGVTKATRDSEASTKLIEHPSDIDDVSSNISESQVDKTLTVSDAIDAESIQRNDRSFGDENIEDIDAGGKSTTEDDKYVVEDFGDDDCEEDNENMHENTSGIEIMGKCGQNDSGGIGDSGDEKGTS